MTENTGGPAFPELQSISRQSNGDRFNANSQGGMSLRDYFAAHAPEVPDLQAFPLKQWVNFGVVDLGNGQVGPRNVPHQESWIERSARWAMVYADAMLAERVK